MLEKKLKVVNQRLMTRSGLVSAAYSFFDVLGLTAPYVIKAKLLLQTLIRKRLGRDDLIEETGRTQWKHWLDDLSMKEMQVDRCFKSKEFDEVKETVTSLLRCGSSKICSSFISPFIGF